MVKTDFQEVVETLKDGAVELAKDKVKNYTIEAKADGLELVESLKKDIQKWGKQLVAGDLSKEDVEFVVMAEKEVIEMYGLQKSGMALIQVDEFKNSLLQLIIKTIRGLI